MKNKINDTIKNVIKMGLNSVNTPKISNDSDVYLDPPIFHYRSIHFLTYTRNVHTSPLVFIFIIR